MFGSTGGCGKGGGLMGGAFSPLAQMMGKFGGGHACGPGAFPSELNLSDDQLERIAELKGEGLAQLMQCKLSMGLKFKQIIRELASENLDKAKIKEIGKQLQSEKEQCGEQFLDRMISVAEVLTPAQRKQLRLKLIRKFLGIDGGFQHED